MNKLFWIREKLEQFGLILLLYRLTELNWKSKIAIK